MKLFYVPMAILFCGLAFAGDIELSGKQRLQIQLPDNHARIATSSVAANVAGPRVKSITLMKINLSDRAHQALRTRAQNVLLKEKTPAFYHAKAPRNVQLGMNGVPVLDQGNHGSCVTFANTAAIDAAMNAGDYISQLCQLQLGNHLEKNAYIPSGWNGSFGSIVLNQISTFGVISKKEQRSSGCGGLKEYPIDGEDSNAEMTVPEFHELSQRVDEYAFTWSPLVDVYQVFLEETKTSEVLSRVKQGLRQGNRSTFGVLLADLHLGTVGAVGKFHAANDSWVLTPEIINDIESGSSFSGGHEMVITGYDDDAVAIDSDGGKHQGLLTIRNSWGADVGDEGNFYMSYDYFKTLVLEAQLIRGSEG